MKNAKARLFLLGAGLVLSVAAGPLFISAQGQAPAIDVRHVPGLAIAPRYIDTGLPVRAAARQDIGGGVTGLEIVDVQGTPRVFVVSEYDPSGPLETRLVRSDAPMAVAGRASGYATHLQYAADGAAGGVFAGVQIDRVKPMVLRVVIKEFQTENSLYRGGVEVGQIIRFSPTDVTWIGFMNNSYFGVDGAAIEAAPIAEVREKRRKIFFQGLPSPGLRIETPGVNSVALFLGPSGCSIRYRLIRGGGGGGGAASGFAGYASLFGSRNFNAMLQVSGDPAALAKDLIDGIGRRLLAPNPQWPADGDLFKDFVTLAQVYIGAGLSTGRRDFAEAAGLLLRHCARAKKNRSDFGMFTPSWTEQTLAAARRLAPEFF